MHTSLHQKKIHLNNILKFLFPGARGSPGNPSLIFAKILCPCPPWHDRVPTLRCSENPQAWIMSGHAFQHLYVKTLWLGFGVLSEHFFYSLVWSLTLSCFSTRISHQLTFIFLDINKKAIFLSIYLSIYMSVCLSIYLPISVSVYLST